MPPRFFLLAPDANMTAPERIGERVRQLPEREQAEVLDFVEFLLARPKRDRPESDSAEQNAPKEEDPARREVRAWVPFSVSSALRGMEDEDGPTYTRGRRNRTLLVKRIGHAALFRSLPAHRRDAGKKLPPDTIAESNLHTLPGWQR
jgi:hypothetical protein